MKKNRNLGCLSLTVSLLLSGCSVTDKETKELEKIVEDVDFNNLKTNDEINSINTKIEQINGESDSFKNKKNEIQNELKNSAINVWKDSLINAIDEGKWYDYFNYRESLVFRDYYYWFSDESYRYEDNDSKNYIIQNKFTKCSNNLSDISIDNSLFLIADKKFEEIYTLTQYLSVFSASSKETPNTEPPYSDFVLKLWKYDLSHINPNYDGALSDEISEFAIKVFGSKEVWEDYYKYPKKYITGNPQHYYFLSTDEINKYYLDKYSQEKIEEYKQSETEWAEYAYNSYLNEQNNNNNSSNNSSSINDGFILENSQIVTDKDILVKCWTVATEEVKKNLKSPSTARFPFSAISQDVDILKDGNYYCVVSWVEAENSFGATIRSDFVVLIKENDGQFIAYDCAIE